MNIVPPAARRLVAWAVAGLICATAPAAAQNGADPAKPSDRRPLILITGEITGFYFPVGGAICRMAGRERGRHGLRCLIEPSPGNAANLAALRSGEADLAIVQSRAQRQSFRGEGPFAPEGAFADMRSLASLHGEALVVLAAKSAGVKTLADLKGKKVNLGRPGSFQRLMAEAALAGAGLTPEAPAAVLEMDLSQQKDGLCDGRIDAAFFSGLHPMAVVQDALARCEVEIVDLSADSVAKVTKAEPYLAAHEIPAEVYDGLEKDVDTVAMKATLVATEELEDEVAYEVVKALVENFDAFQAMHPLLQRVVRTGLPVEGLTAPLHPGAVRYYKEIGLLP